MFGQVFFPRKLVQASRWAFSLANVLFLTTCAGDLEGQSRADDMSPWSGPEGRWIGPVTPLGPDCGLRTTGLMSASSRTFAFDPFQGAVVLRGKVDLTGELVGEVVRPGPGNKSITLGFLGRIQRVEKGERIAGTLTSGRCRWSVLLLRR